MDTKEIEKQAKKEIEEEDFRDQVEKEKKRLREHIPLLHRIFPFKIVRR